MFARGTFPLKPLTPINPNNNDNSNNKKIGVSLISIEFIHGDSV